ncbi:MAG: hypothetical protein DMD91_27760 [Candidatus Rokuibacteriota bacterium]|nr:MAG: hypothetical protein DMD91_27760 [Candidatus Rokubacteria bacterium]
MQQPAVVYAPPPPAVVYAPAPSPVVYVPAPPPVIASRRAGTTTLVTDTWRLGTIRRRKGTGPPSEQHEKGTGPAIMGFCLFTE